MRAPLSWIRDFTPVTASPDVIVEALNELGLVVEGVEHIGGGLDGVVVGRALDVRAHPNADRVRLADVDLGTGEPVQIACGAPNLEPGQLVPVATIGATLPNGMTIERRKMRGEWSNGMICAEDELGLSQTRTGGIMVLPAELEVGMDFTTAMKIEPDVVFDLEIETNRPDALCISGIARDLAAKLDLPFSIPEPKIAATGPKVGELTSIDVQDASLCPRFTSRVVQNINVTDSPDWIQRRLTLAGMRPINNVVDASNYVMLELGHPSHPYDLEQVGGAGLVVRAAQDNETIETLDGTSRKLPTGTPVICDLNNTVVGVAGIMGGASSEISDSTTQVLLEMAMFEPYAINLASRKLALRTDASSRFERQIDRMGHERAQLRLCELLVLSCPDAQIATGMLDIATENAVRPPEELTLRTERVNQILGTNLDRPTISALLARIGFSVSETSVTVPTFRPDVEREIDVIEEIARIFGYNNIERRVPTAPSAGRLTNLQFQRRRIRNQLVGMGFSEAWSASLLAESDFKRCGLTDKPISLSNPIVEEESLLRTRLLPGLLRAVAFNTTRQNKVIRLFEIGQVFEQPLAGELLPNEQQRLAVVELTPDSDAKSATRTWLQLSKSLGINDVSMTPATIEGMHPTRSAEIGDFGYAGEVDPAVLGQCGIPGRVAYLELDLPKLVSHINATPQMQPVSRYPSAEFDLAFVVPDSQVAAEVQKTLGKAAGEHLEEVFLFDVFRHESVGADSRSLAFRLRVSSIERTLSDKDIAQIRTKCIEAASKAHNAQLRA